MALLRTTSGTYVLLFDVASGQQVDVGRLGTMHVQAGLYAYVGSAFGPGGVRARVRRHQKKTASPHWHIDYVRPLGQLKQVWHTYDEQRRECMWAKVLRAFPAARVPLDGFGATDCRCSAHLVYFSAPPTLDAFREPLEEIDPDHAPVHRLDRFTHRSTRPDGG